MPLLTSFNPNANEYLDRYADSFKYSGRDCSLRSDSHVFWEIKTNMGLLIGQIGKYFHELLQILANWDENLRINNDKDLSFLLRMLLVRILAWMGTSATLDDEFGIYLLDS